MNFALDPETGKSPEQAYHAEAAERFDRTLRLIRQPVAHGLRELAKTLGLESEIIPFDGTLPQVYDWGRKALLAEGDRPWLILTRRSWHSFPARRSGSIARRSETPSSPTSDSRNLRSRQSISPARRCDESSSTSATSRVRRTFRRNWPKRDSRAQEGGRRRTLCRRDVSRLRERHGLADREAAPLRPGLGEQLRRKRRLPPQSELGRRCGLRSCAGFAVSLRGRPSRERGERRHPLLTAARSMSPPRN